MNTILRKAIGATLYMPSEATVVGIDSAQLVRDTESGFNADERRKVLQEETAKLKEANAKPMEHPGFQEMKVTAEAEAKQAWKEFSGRGGAWEHIKKARERTKAISTHILNMGKEACRIAYARQDMDEDQQLKFAGSLFQYAIQTAELTIRTSADVSNPDELEALDTFLNSSWKVYKSQVKQGIGAGYDLKDFQTVGQLNKAVAEGKAGNGGQAQQAQGEAPGAGETKTAAQIKTMFMDTAEQATRGRDTGKVQYAVTKLMESLGLIPEAVYHEKEEQIANIITKAATEIVNLAGRALDNNGKPVATRATQGRSAQA